MGSGVVEKLRARYLIPAALGVMVSILPAEAQTPTPSPRGRVLVTCAPYFLLTPDVGPVGQEVVAEVCGLSGQIRIRFQTTDRATDYRTWQVVATVFAPDDNNPVRTRFIVPPRGWGEYRVEACEVDTCNVITTKGRLFDGFYVEASFAVTPSSGSAGTTATGRGFGFLPTSTTLIRFQTNDKTDRPERWERVGTVRTDRDGSFSTTFRVPARIPALYDVMACYKCEGSFDPQGYPFATDDFTVVAPRSQKKYTPRLTVEPPIAPHGFVVQARGEGFRPGAAVSLNWNIGLDREVGVVVAGADGRFGVQILILPRDFLGRRVLTATAIDHSPARDDCLVVLGQYQPSKFAFRR